MIDLPDINITEIMTKIILRNDIPSTWENSIIVLERGEPALELDLDKKVAKIKIGDGKHTFSELPYSTITPDEVKELIEQATIGAGSIKSISLESGTENGTLKFIVNDIPFDNIAVTGLKSAAFTDASDYATAAQGVKADNAMAFRGTIASLPTANILKGDTYRAISTFIIPASISYTGVEVEVSDGDMVVAMDDGVWMCVPCGKAEVAKVADTAKTLEHGISASMSGGIVGSANAANAGDTLNIEVSSVNTDFLANGTKTLILNGGSASTM